jgi:hypothetical protein
VIGYHYSSEPIPLGDIITSDQHKAQTFSIVWEVYKEVADELGLYFPKEYGYAYQENQNRSFRFKYTVDADSRFVTRGHTQHSVYFTMAHLSHFMDRRIPSLAERLVNRRKLLKTQARHYFLSLHEPENIEMISDQWCVVQPK